MKDSGTRRTRWVGSKPGRWTSGAFQLHEVKGHWQDDARAKIKIAADMYPFEFIAVRKRSKKEGGGFAEERF